MKTIDGIRSNVHRTTAIIGGIHRLEPQYRQVVTENDFIPRIFNQHCIGLKERVEQTDVIILFIGTVSHKVARQVRKLANLRAIPLITIRRSSVTALKRAVDKLCSANKQY